jgi:hypothetical protein
MTISAHRRQQRSTRRRRRTSGDSFTSVYVDKAARLDMVRGAVDRPPMQIGVTKVVIDDRSVTDTFGCRIAIDLTGAFDETADGKTIACNYAQQLTAILGVPAFAFYDLLRTDPAQFIW